MQPAVINIFEKAVKKAGKILLRDFGELENLQNAVVFSYTIIKIQFPDRNIIEANFHPKETILADAMLAR